MRVCGSVLACAERVTAGDACAWRCVMGCVVGASGGCRQNLHRDAAFVLADWLCWLMMVGHVRPVDPKLGCPAEPSRTELGCRSPAHLCSDLQSDFRSVSDGFTKDNKVLWPSSADPQDRTGPAVRATTWFHERLRPKTLVVPARLQAAAAAPLLWKEAYFPAMAALYTL